MLEEEMIISLNWIAMLFNMCVPVIYSFKLHVGGRQMLFNMCFSVIYISKLYVGGRDDNITQLDCYVI